jgi:hypothetical protein
VGFGRDIDHGALRVDEDTLHPIVRWRGFQV